MQTVAGILILVVFGICTIGMVVMIVRDIMGKNI